jgi:hypothetical protein
VPLPSARGARGEGGGRGPSTGPLTRPLTRTRPGDEARSPSPVGSRGPAGSISAVFSALSEDRFIKRRYCIPYALSGNTAIPEGDLKAIDELRDELVGVLRKKRALLAELHCRGMDAGFYAERAVHDRVEQLLADIIKELEWAGFVFDPDMVEGVLKKLNRNWLGPVRQYLVC